MRCKTKQRKGSRLDLILGYRRTTTNENSPGIRPACGADEMNDHQVATATQQNAAYRHRNYGGRFRKRRRPSLFQATDGVSLEFLRRRGSTFSTSASAVMPCFFRRIGTAPCSMNCSGQPIRTTGVLIICEC